MPRRAFAGTRLRRLAAHSGLQVLGGGRGSGGTAVLGSAATASAAATTAAVGQARVLALPVERWWTRRRGAVIVRLPGLTVVSVHLPLTPAARAAHARLVVEGLAEVAAGVAVGGDRVVIAGDLNEPPDHPAWQVFAELVVDPDPVAAPTFPARSPGSRIDAVLVDPRLPVVRYAVADVDPTLVRVASDHWPVVADLLITPDPAPDGPPQ